MSDSELPDEERLRYAGATTRHEGPGDTPKKLEEAAIDDLPFTDDDAISSNNAVSTGDTPADAANLDDIRTIQPGVGSASENHATKPNDKY